MSASNLKDVLFDLPPSYFTTQSFDPDSVPDAYDISRKQLEQYEDEHKWGEGIIFASIDSGVDRTHPEFEDRVVEQIDVTDSIEDGDPLGHGTAVMSKILGRLIGVAKKAKGISIRVTNDEGRGRGDWVIEGFRRVLDMKPLPHFVNASIGSERAVPELEEICAELVRLGVVVITASGNDFRKKMRYPAQYESCLSVGGMSKDHVRLAFSNFDHKLFALDLVDYGEDVISASLGHKYRPMTGTSHAAPGVTGMLGLRLRAEQTGSQISRWDLPTKQEQLKLACKRLTDEERSKELGWGYLDSNLLFGENALPVDFQVLEAPACSGVVDLADIHYGVVSTSNGKRLVVDGKYYPLGDPIDVPPTAGN